MAAVVFSVGGFSVPQGVAAGHGLLAVADTGNNQIAVLNQAALPGGSAARLGGPGTDPAAEGLRLPGAVVFTAADHLVVADTHNGHLDRYALVGGVWTWQGTVPIGGTVQDVAVLGTDLLVLDSAGRRVLRVEPSGAVTLHHADPYWLDPAALTIHAGNLWVADAGRHQVLRYDAVFTRTAFGGYGSAPGRLRAPRGLAFLGGSLYVAESDGARLSVFDSAGTFQHVVTLPTGVSHRPQKIAVDAGRLYLADQATQRVYCVDPAAAPGAARFEQTALAFGGVAVGYRLRLPCAVRNDGTAPLTVTSMMVDGIDFAIDPASPAAPFPLPPGGRTNLWISYRPTVTRRMTGTVLVSTDSPAQPQLALDLSGEGLVAEPLAAALVLDTSGSMALPAGAVSKIERLRGAGAMLVDLLTAAPGNELAVVPFDTSAVVALPRQELAPAAGQATKVVTDLMPAGLTSIGDGLRLAFGELATSALDRRHAVVVTDGQQNTPPLIADVPVPAGTRLFTVGVGLPQYLDAATLRDLATGTGGYFQITDGDEHKLAKFLVQIFSDVSGLQPAVDPFFVFGPGDRRELPVPVTSADHEMTVVLSWDRPGAGYEVELITPDATVLTATDFAWTGQGMHHLAVRLRLEGTHRGAGSWTVRAIADPAAPGDDLCGVAVLLASNAHLDWEITPVSSERASATGPEEVITWVGQTALPPVPRPVIPPGQTSRGDLLRITARPTFPLRDLRLIGGTLEIRPPGRSLADLQRQSAGIDLDRLDRPSPLPPPEHGPLQRLSFRPDRARDAITVEFRLDGPDGIYEASARVRARTLEGQIVQRERTFTLYARP